MMAAACKTCGVIPLYAKCLCVVKRQVSSPRIVLANLRGGITWYTLGGLGHWTPYGSMYVAAAVSPGMSSEGHAFAQAWIDGNFVTRAQAVVNARKAQAAARAARAVLMDATFRQRWIDDAHKRAEARVVRGAMGEAFTGTPAPTVRVCDCAQCMAVAEARRVELWKPILHAEAHLRAKSSMHAYNSALSMVN